MKMLVMQHEDASVFAIKHLSIKVYYMGKESCNKGIRVLKYSSDISVSVILPFFFAYQYFTQQKNTQKRCGSSTLDKMDKISILKWVRYK